MSSYSILRVSYEYCNALVVEELPTVAATQGRLWGVVCGWCVHACSVWCGVGGSVCVGGEGIYVPQ